MRAAHPDSVEALSDEDLRELPVAEVRVEERWLVEINGETKEIPTWYLGKWPDARRQTRRIITTEWSDE